MLVSPHIQRGRTYGIPHIWTPDDEFGIPGDLIIHPSSGNWVTYPNLDAAHDLGTLAYRWRNGRFSGDVRTATLSSASTIALNPAAGSYVDQSTQGTPRPRYGGVIFVDIVTQQSNATADTLMTYTIPANTLGVNEEWLRVKCWGTNAAGFTKSVFLQIASTNIVTSGASPHSGDWSIDAMIFRESASAVRTLGLWDSVAVGGSVLRQLTSTVAMAKDLTTNLALELKCTTTFTHETDVTQHGMLVEWHPGQ